MADKILLCISATQAVMAHTRGKHIVHCEIFSAGEAGLAAFDEFLGTAITNASTRVYLTADTVEEDYRLDTLPRATGADRTNMLERKLKQYYRNTPYTAAIPRNRSQSRRHDEPYLFTAMTNPALILPWLAAVNRHYLPVAGIYLVSMLTAALVRKTGHDLTRLLVVAPHGPGLRLTFFKDGELCVSRLSRGSKGSAAARDAGAIAAEISSTRAYLAMLQLDSPDDTLKVLFVDSDDGLAGMVESVASESANLQCVRVSRADLIRQLQMAPEHLDVALETAYLKLMAEQAPAAANLASVAITAKHRQIQRSNAVYAAGAALGLAGLAWSGFNLWQAHDIAETTAGDAKRTAAAQTQYRDLAREFPAIPTTTDNLINTVENYKKLSRAVRSPQPFMQIVSRAVEPSREVFLQEINWVYRSDTPNASGSTTGSTAGSSAGGARPAQPGAAPEAAGDARQTGYVSGEIRPFAGDYRAAIDAINLIAKRLARDPAVAEAQVVKYPLNVNPGLSLSGNTKESSEPSGAAEFKITLTLKPDA